MIVYKVTNLINGKIYVGQDSKNRKNYYGSGQYIKRAIKKYRIENFIKDILAYCYSQNELNAYETYWIEKLNSKVPNGYNLTNGGEGILGYNHTEKAKQKISIHNKGKTTEGLGHKTNCQCYFCKARRGETKGKNSVNYGRRHSEETKQKHCGLLSKRGHKSNCQCYFCKSKRGEYRGKNSINYKHGETGTRLYRIWKSMKARCKHNKNYIEKGIQVCSKWKDDFIAFKNWALFHHYNNNNSRIRRKNYCLNYSSRNCKWIIKK